MIQAVIFNLDGVLIATDRCHEQAWRDMAREMGIPFEGEIYRRMRGRKRMESLTELLKKAERPFSPGETWALAARKNDLFNDSILSLGREAILPGAEDTLRALREMGVKTAVASSSENASGLVRQMKLDGLMDAVVDGEDVEMGKPDPEVLLLAARKLRVPTCDCLVIENTLSGAQAARQAGMPLLLMGDEEGAQAPDLAGLNIPDLVRKSRNES